MTTESHSVSGEVSNIPASAREFERWFDEKKAEWLTELQRLGQMAMLALKMFDQPEAQAHPRIQSETAKDLLAFAEAYGKWRAGQ